MTDAWPLIRRLLGSSLAQLGRVLVPSVAASIPALCLLIWISTAYGHVFPAGDAPPLRPTPPSVQARWLDTGAADRRLALADALGWRVEVTVAAPVTVIGRWRWWNLLMGNPAGYLPADAPADRVEIELPERQYLGIGPRWLRGWEFPFFTALLLVSLVFRRLLRIE